MAYKVFSLGDNLNVSVYKRSRSKNIRLTLSPTGEVKVSIPSWAPYRAGLAFAISRREWIIDSRPRATTSLEPGQAVGKAHHLEFIADERSSRPSGRVSESIVSVHHHVSLSSTHDSVQSAARRACIRALGLQANTLLPQRLQLLAEKHGLSYSDVSVRQLKSRWGSCDSKGKIVLSLYLMQMPWELIDYVLLHELTHTVVLRHGPDFWNTLERILPGAKRFRKDLKTYRPVINGYPPARVA